jgi:ribosomal protein S27E
MITTATANRVAGLEFIKARCPQCGNRAYRKPCPCWMTNKGWAECAKCVRCGHTIGLRKAGRR